jgi:hypothetical protein
MRQRAMAQQLSPVSIPGIACDMAGQGSDPIWQTLMCTEHFLMIRYKTNVILWASTRSVHSCAWISYYIYYNSYYNYLIISVKQKSRQIYAIFSNTLHWFLGLAVSTPDIGRVDLCSNPKGGSNLTWKKRYTDIFWLVLNYTHYTFYTHYFAGQCPPKNIGTARISPTQGAFCSVQLSGDWTHQVQGCAASILQSVFCENVLWQSSIGPSHHDDKAAGHW